jgi:hypothetical protein
MPMHRAMINFRVPFKSSLCMTLKKSANTAINDDKRGKKVLREQLKMIFSLTPPSSAAAAAATLPFAVSVVSFQFPLNG